MTSRLVTAALVLLAGSLPAGADEFTDTLESALSAYRDGDVDGARQDVEYAGKLLVAMKSESLAKFLPEAPPGWTRGEGDPSEGAGFMGMLGGGTSASATYTRGGEEMSLSLVANSPMVSGMAAMVSGIGALGGGKPMRIQRTEFSQNDQSLQGVVNGKVLVNVDGNAAVEDKRALLEAIDFKALGEF